MKHAVRLKKGIPSTTRLQTVGVRRGEVIHAVIRHNVLCVRGGSEVSAHVLSEGGQKKEIAGQHQEVMK